jgi:DNA-binding transcriptional LysR family regulator
LLATPTPRDVAFDTDEETMDLLDKMTTYVSVIDAGSFSAAAKRLKITSGAVSRQIAALEAELHVTLIARSTRSMAVTAAGRRYHEHCLRVLHEVAAAQSVGRARGVEGTVRISAPVSFGLSRVMPHLATLRAKHPSLGVEIHLEDRLLDPVLEGFDVLIRAGATVPITGGVVARKLTEFPFVLVAAPAYLERRGRPVTPEALVGHAALSCHVAPGPDVWVLGDGRREARIPMTASVVFRCSALQGVRDLALAGHGLALLPRWLIVDEIAKGALQPVLAGWTTPLIPVSAIFRTTERQTPRLRAVVDHLVSAFADTTAPPARTSRASRSRA